MERHRQMMVFQAVAETSGLAAASRQLGISEATVGRSLAALEQRLGAQLLTRSTRGVRLTERGRQFADDCARVLRATDEADASANGYHVEPRGLLTLVTPPLLGDRLMMPVVLRYLDEWPDIEMSVVYRNAVPDLHEEGVDVAVVIGDVPDATLVARRVGAVRQTVCASPDYLRRCGEPRTPEDLSDHALILCSADSRAQAWQFQRTGSSRNPALKPVLRCTSQQGSIDAALQGVGLAWCLSHDVHEHLEAGRLTSLPHVFAGEPLAVSLVYREGLRASARVRSFVDFAVARMRVHPMLKA